MHLMSLLIKNPADDWHAAGGHLMLGPFVPFCASSVLRMQRRESATALSGEPAHQSKRCGMLWELRAEEVGLEARGESHMCHS